MRVLAALLLTLLAGSCVPTAASGPIPAEAQRYQRELVRQVQAVWGLDGSVALHAAQVHQESAWRAHVDSPAGAQGMAQFMPGTSAWMAELYPELGAAAPYSPGWALAAMTRYNRRIYNGLSPLRAEALPHCDRLAMMLSGYNGGPGWVNRDRRLAASRGADPDRWWGEVENHTNRADWAYRENRHYPRRIIHELEPRYLAAGWPGVRSCP